MGSPRFFVTDVFTARKYGGNPLATFVDCEAVSGTEMQKIAKEINFSETAFVTSLNPGVGYDVRIFTPNSEVVFAGHPTLGAAHVIRNRLLRSQAREVVLNLPIGRIPVSFSDGAAGMEVLWMKQPAPEFGKMLDATSVATVLGVSLADIDPSWPIQEISTGFPHIVVPVKSLEALRRVKIDKVRYFALIANGWAKAILVFSREGYEAGQDLAVRVFGDFYGIPEDAATGSGNGCLAAYLVRYKIFGKQAIDVSAGQGYELGRPSALSLRANETPDGMEVLVGGSVVDVAEGRWICSS